MEKMSSKGAMMEEIRIGKVPVSGFDRSNHNFGTGKLGKIIPVRWDEKYPGDRVKGKPINVINFEPMVAPVMGSMVTKMESFFVPWYQIWRNSPKFWTEKKGFNTPMPSISPKGILEAYSRSDLYGFFNTGSIVVNIVKYLRDGELADPLISSVGEFVGYILTVTADSKNSIITYGETYYVLDLLTPVLNLIKDFEKSLSPYEDVEDNDIASRKKIAELLDDLHGKIFNYYFGVSSLFDYLGFPMKSDFYSIATDYSSANPNSFYGLAFQNIEYDDADIFTQYLSWTRHFSDVPLNWSIFRAYYVVWYWNYRDQLLEQDAYDPESDDFLADSVSDQNAVLCSLLRVRCWFKDAFTTALTNTGSGNLLVPTEPFSEVLHVDYYNDDQLINTADRDAAFEAGATTAVISTNSINFKVPMNYLRGSFTGSPESTGDGSYVSLDLFDRIRKLRTFTQKHLINGYEMDDVIWASFEVKLSNVRMHIPEILSRGRDAVEMNTIVNNTTTAEQIAGDKTAVAFCKSQSSDINYFCEEWGLFIQNMTVMPIQCYPDSMQRTYLKRDRLDFMWPEFAQMGMDAVYLCELAKLGDVAPEDGLSVFGYQGRYYDLKSRQDEVHGRLRTDMNYYVFGRTFDNNNLPKLNYIFVHCWPSNMPFVVDNDYDDVFRYDCYNAIAESRKLPVASEIIG